MTTANAKLADATASSCIPPGPNGPELQAERPSRGIGQTAQVPTDQTDAETIDAERAARIAAAAERVRLATERTAAAAAAVASIDATTAERVHRRRSVAERADAERAAWRVKATATADGVEPTDAEISARFAILARPENQTMILSVSTHAARNRAHGRLDATDIAQSLAMALAHAKSGTANAKAMALMAIAADDGNRKLTRRHLSNLARAYAQHDAERTAKELPSVVVTMAYLNETQTEAHAAAIAADGVAVWTDKDNANRINGATAFAAAMGNANATARDAESDRRVGNAEYVKRTREQTIGGNAWDASGVVRIVKEKSLENMLIQQMSVKGMLIGGVHGGGGSDAADGLAMRRFRETFYSAPTPRMGGSAIAARLANAADRLTSRKARAWAAFLASHASGRQRSALQAIGSGQVNSWGTLVAACVVSTRPQQRRRSNRRVTAVASVAAFQTNAASLGDGGQTIATETKETSRVDWKLFLSLLGENGGDAAVRRVAIDITQTIARDSGALHDAARTTHAVMTTERIASPNTRGGMTPMVRFDQMRDYRGTPHRLRADAAPPALRIARHAEIKDNAAVWTDTDDNAAMAPWRGDPPQRINALGVADPFGHLARPIWADPID